jgi:outer membrane protein OmpA-like peptidoglycan-associated protein
VKYKYLLFILLMALTTPIFLSAQTASALEELLDSHTLSMHQAAWLVLEAANIPLMHEVNTDAFGYAVSQRWLPVNARPGDPIRLDQSSLLMMRAFGIKGGMFYRLIGSPRYAYRELTYLNVIQGRADPAMAVSGELLLFMVGRILSEFVDELSYMGTELLTHEEVAEEIRTELEAIEVSNVTVEVVEEGIMLSISDIQFEADSAILMSSELEKLREIARILLAVRVRSLQIAGHTAMAGTPEERLQTSLERALAVKDFLVSLGVLGEGAISVIGYGAERPISDNDTPRGMSINRRVEIIILERD